MKTNDFNTSLDNSDFPLSIEELAAYLDDNLSEDEMQRVESVIEHNEALQDVMYDIEMSEQALAECELKDGQTPDSMVYCDFPEYDNLNDDGGDLCDPANELPACSIAPEDSNLPLSSSGLIEENYMELDSIDTLDFLVSPNE